MASDDYYVELSSSRRHLLRRASWPWGRKSFLKKVSSFIKDNGDKLDYIKIRNLLKDTTYEGKKACHSVEEEAHYGSTTPHHSS